MEPVELDINIRGNASAEASRIAEGVSSIGDSADRATEELKRSLELQKQYLARLKKEIQTIELEMKASPRAQATMGRHLHELKKELIDETEGLRHLQSELRVTTSTKESLRSKIYEVKDAMARMVNAGERETEQYARARRELETLNDAYQTVTREQRMMTKGAQSLSGVADGLRGLLGAVTAGVGAYGALSGESERFARIQTKVQSLLAITIGLQQLQQSLSATSAFRIKTLTAVTGAFGRAQTYLATTLHLSNGAAKALMATLSLGLSVAVTAVAGMIDRYVERQREAAEAAREWGRAVSSEAGGMLARYEALRREYAALEGDEERRRTFVREHREDFDELGVSISTAAEADNLFVTNAEAFRQSMMERAKAVASFNLAVDAYKEALEAAEAAATRAVTVSWWDKAKASLVSFGSAMNKSTFSMSGTDMAKRAAEDIETESDRAMERAEGRIQQMLDFRTEADRLFQAAGFRTPSTRGSKEEATAGADAGRRKALLDRIARMGADAERSATALEIAAMREGRARKLRELEEEHRERVDKIRSQMQELEEIRAAGRDIDVSPVRSRLAALSEQETADYTRKRRELMEASDDVIRQVEEAAAARSHTALEHRLSEVDAYYDRLLAKARAHASSEEELRRVTARLEEAASRERELRRRESELSLLDLEEEIEMRRLSMSARRYALEADREEATLRRQLEMSEKRLRKLEEIKAAGGDATADIRKAREEIKGLREELERIPARRLGEVAKGIRSIASALASVGGEVGEVFSSAASAAGDIAATLREGATSMDLVTTAASGLSRVLSMVINQSRANAREEERLSEASARAYHRAALARIRAAEGVRKGSILGIEDPYRGAIAGARRYRQAMVELSRSMERLRGGKIQTGTKQVVSGTNIAKGALGGAATGAALGSIIPGLGTLIGGAIGAVLGGLGGALATKTVPVFKSLEAQYGRVLKAGSKSFELNPKILEDYDLLDEATRKIVDNWEEIRREALEAEEQMSETFRHLAGDIGGELSRALSEAFRSGDWETSLRTFEGEVDRMIGRIVDQLLISAIFGEELKRMEESMKASFGAGGDQTITDELIDFKRKYRTLVDTYRREREAASRELGLQGVNDRPDTSVRTAVARRGLAQASQDSIDELMGIATNQLLQLRLLVEAQRGLREEGHLRSEVIRSIARDVASIASYAPRLDLLEEVSRDIAALRRDGITIK